MGWIATATTQQLLDRINESNCVAATKRTRYPKWEDKAIAECYMFAPCACDENCFCCQHGCNGHWVIKENLSFRDFLRHYAHLWAPYQNALQNAVLYGSAPHPRNKKAIPFLKARRDSWLDNGQPFLRSIAMQNKCMVCDKPLDSLAKSFVDSAKNIYESKAVSQLYYDIIVPYDTGSRHEMMRMGYDDPERSLVKVNDQLRNDVQAFIVRNGLTLLEFRRLDNPSAYFPEIRQRPEGHPFSRVIDKVFYTP